MKFVTILTMTLLMITSSAFAAKGTQWSAGGGPIGCYTSDSVHAHCYCSGSTGNQCTSCGPGSACTFGNRSGTQKPVQAKNVKTK